jgi:signal peptidase II
MHAGRWREAAEGGPGRVRLSFWMMAAAVVALDQWTKMLVQRALPLNGDPLPLVPRVVYLTHVHNEGMAFGQFRGAGPVLIVAAVAAALAIIFYRAHLLGREGALHPLLNVGLALPLGGAIGNMIDRVRLGRVVDFIDLRWWPVFNVADSAITVGAVVLMCYFLLVNPPDAERSAGVPQTESVET